MTYDEAIEASVSRDEVFAELTAHCVTADYDAATGELFDCVTGETIAMPNAEGDYDGAAILSFLGY